MAHCRNLSFAIVSDPEGDGVPFEINQQNELRTLQNLDFEQVSLTRFLFK